MWSAANIASLRMRLAPDLRRSPKSETVRKFVPISPVYASNTRLQRCGIAAKAA